MGNSLTFEVVQFKLAQGTDEGEFLKAADAMLPDLKKESGFISRDLLKDENDQWVDIARWKTEAEAKTAGDNFMNYPSCLKFINMIDQSTLKIGFFVLTRTYSSEHI